MSVKRIAGIDVARALAIIGMIVVNFKTVFGAEGSTLLSMVNGIVSAVIVLSSCILLTKRFSTWVITDALTKTGQLALTFYVAHVIIGMGVAEGVLGISLGSSSINFSVGYALMFSLACIVFAITWRRFFTAGPLEWIMRKVTG